MKFSFWLWAALCAVVAMAIISAVTPVRADVVGSVETAFRLVGPNHTVQVERFDDPVVDNISCYVSYAQSGGLSSLVGLSEDPSRFSIACRAVGPVSIEGVRVPTEFVEVFNRSTSLLFGEMRVSRMLDTDTNVLVYLVWSTRLIDGSPFNSVTAVAID